MPYRSKCFVTMTSSTGPILVLTRINPFGWDLSSLGKYEHSRHDLVEPYPSKWTSGMAVKSCPWDTFLIKKLASSQAFNWTYPGKCSNFSSCCRTKFPQARRVQNGPLVRLDTSSDGTCGSTSLSTFVTSVAWPQRDWPWTRWASSCHQSAMAEYWAGWRRRWCVLRTLQLQVPRCNASMSSTTIFAFQRSSGQKTRSSEYKAPAALYK